MFSLQKLPVGSLMNCVRRYSIYGSQYIPAAFNHELLDEQYEEDELELVKDQLVYPALISQRQSAYYEKDIQSFLHKIMMGGNKHSANLQLEKAFYDIKRIQVGLYNRATTDEERSEIECNPREVLRTALENIRPLMSTLNVNRGGIIYQVPVPLTEKRSYWFAEKWLVEAGREKTGLTKFYSVLAKEIMAASRGEGKCVKKKIDLHKLCAANKAFSHYIDQK